MAIVVEKRSVWMRDVVLLWLGTGTCVTGTVLFMWSVLYGSFGGTGSVAFWLALFTLVACSAIGVLAILSRQRGVIGETEVAPPWYPLITLRRARGIPYGMLKEVKVENRGSLRRGILTLVDGRRLRVELLDFESPDTAAQVLEEAGSKREAVNA